MPSPSRSAFSSHNTRPLSQELSQPLATLGATLMWLTLLSALCVSPTSLEAKPATKAQAQVEEQAQAQGTSDKQPTQAGAESSAAPVEGSAGETSKKAQADALSAPKQEELAVENQTPRELDVEIKERLGEKIPLGLIFKDEQGQDIVLGQYFNKGKPILLNLVYFNCPMLCNMVLNGALEGLRELAWVPGEEFEIVTVSISPRETPELALAKKNNYLEQLGLEGAERGWHFLTGDADSIKALADSVGFGFRYDPSSQDYAHGAAIFFLASDATITRYLYGITFPAKQLRLALTEAGRGEVGSVMDRILMRCFMYEPSHKKYGFYIWGAMRLGGVLTVIILGGFLLLLWANERRAKANVTQGEPPPPQEG